MAETDGALRIAYIAGEYPAASHTFILREVTALRQQGYEVDTYSIRTVSAKTLGAQEQEAAESTFNILSAAKNPLTLFAAQGFLLKAPGQYIKALSLAFKLRTPGVRALLFQIIYFLEATVFARQAAAQGITHIHGHFANASCTVALLASKLLGSKFSFTLHGPSDLFEAERWRLRDKVEHADFVACISHFARSQAMLNSSQSHWSKLKIVHCGVVPDMYVAQPQPAGPLRLVFVGRVAAVKGLPVLLDALMHLKKKGSVEAQLTIVGDGPERAVLEQQARPLGSGVNFVGYKSQNEVAEILSASNALVLPSFAEGVPVVLMEAMASGRPVIATRVAGVSELVEEGISGFLVPPGDSLALADRIEALAQDAALRDQMGRAGRAHVQAEFDIVKEACRLADLFEGRMVTGPRQ